MCVPVENCHSLLLFFIYYFCNYLNDVLFIGWQIDSARPHGKLHFPQNHQKNNKKKRMVESTISSMEISRKRLVSTRFLCGVISHHCYWPFHSNYNSNYVDKSEIVIILGDYCNHGRFMCDIHLSRRRRRIIRWKSVKTNN